MHTPSNFFVYHKEIKHLCRVSRHSKGVCTVEYDNRYRECGNGKFESTNYDELYSNCCSNPFEIVSEELDTVVAMIELIS